MCSHTQDRNRIVCWQGQAKEFRNIFRSMSINSLMNDLLMLIYFNQNKIEAYYSIIMFVLHWKLSCLAFLVFLQMHKKNCTYNAIEVYCLKLVSFMLNIWNMIILTLCYNVFSFVLRSTSIIFFLFSFLHYTAFSDISRFFVIFGPVVCWSLHVLII